MMPNQMAIDMPVVERKTTAVEPAQPSRKNWQPYDANDVIDAYLKGKEAGRGEVRKIVEEKFRENLEKAQSSTENFCKQLHESLSLHVKGLYMGIDSIVDFHALMLVPVDDFVSDRMRDAYVSALEAESNLKSTAFSLRFEFAPLTEATDESSIFAGGFVYKYEPGERE